MSRWTHSLCRACYAAREPDREPVVVRDVGVECCCSCGEDAWPAIFYRADPLTFACFGEHGLDGRDVAGE